MKSERPDEVVRGQVAMEWGSDAVAEVLSRLGVRYIALNPGSSYRGLHDSLVNYNANSDPQMLICLHEEVAVAVAHGYAKVTGHVMAVGLHSNVGLMHASMAIYNAYCDRVPMLILGANGPVDAARRRPWIDWIHTSADPGALIRDYSKWDDQPVSVQASVDSVARAHAITSASPSAPTYVVLDVDAQEERLTSPPALPDVARDRTPRVHGPDSTATAIVTDLLHRAQRPLLLLGRVSREPGDWDRRIELAERYGAMVLCDLKVGAAFPTGHALNPIAPSVFLSADAGRLIASADLIISLDWIDLGGTLTAAADQGHEVSATVVSCSRDAALLNGWSKDHFAYTNLDLTIDADPDSVVEAVLQSGHAPLSTEGWADNVPRPAPVSRPPAEGPNIFMADLADALYAALQGRPATLVRLPLGWRGRDLNVQHPLDYLGIDGGAGIGSGPGMTVGAALGLAGTGRLAVGVLGDGDFLMGGTAIWTAAHYELPMLIVVANNAYYYNDVVHQERVAATRGRPEANTWIGQAIADPEPDLAAFARSMGLQAFDQVREVNDLAGVLAAAVQAARQGASVVVDVRVRPDGYLKDGE